MRDIWTGSRRVLIRSVLAAKVKFFGRHRAGSIEPAEHGDPAGLKQ
jgi:hypothetical protein